MTVGRDEGVAIEIPWGDEMEQVGHEQQPEQQAEAAGGVPQPETEPAPTRGGWKSFIVIAAVVVVALIGFGVLRSADLFTPRFEKAADACEVPWLFALGDEGKTLALSGGGEEATMYSIEDIACILNELDVPDSVLLRIDSTRALDGQQVAEWDGITARWTYHPDPGLSIILTEE